MNKWQPIIKLTLAMGIFVLAIYVASAHMENMIMLRGKQMKKDNKKITLTGRVDFMRRKSPVHTKFDELLEETGKLKYYRDPFVMEKKPVVEAVQAPPKEGPLILQGIMWEDNAHPKAMINGEVIEIGSFIDHFMVVDIEADHVTLIDNDPAALPDQKTLKLHLNNP